MNRTDQVKAIINKLESGRRHYISDVAVELGWDMSGREKGYLAAILFRLESDGQISLYQLDNPQERPGHVEISTPSGSLRHIIYV